MTRGWGGVATGKAGVASGSGDLEEVSGISSIGGGGVGRVVWGTFLLSSLGSFGWRFPIGGLGRTPRPSPPPKTHCVIEFRRASERSVQCNGTVTL